MTIGRISGPMLNANLLRDGVDLSIETNLLYVDASNLRLGINTSTPNVLLDINGITRFSSALQISGQTISSVATNSNINLTPNGTGKVLVSTLTPSRLVYSSTSGALVDSSNLTFDGTTLTVNALNITSTPSFGNLSISSNNISSTNTNGNINLVPNGTGNVVINTATANRIFYSGTNKELLTNPNLTFDGSTFAMGNISIASNNINSTNTNGNINLVPNGTGNVVINTATANRVFYAGTNKELLTNANLTFNGTTLTVNNLSTSSSNNGNILVSSNDISSTNTNGNINLTPNGTGRVKVVSTSALLLPTGITSQRPATPATGDLRYNSEFNALELFNGTIWLTVADNTTSFITARSFVGDGTTINFNLGQNTNSAGALVSVNGVIQQPGIAYSVSGSTLTFNEAPISSDEIDVRVVSSAVSTDHISDLTTRIDAVDSTQTITTTIHGNPTIVVNSTGLIPAVDNTYNLGSSSFKWATIYGTSTSAQYADLAENFIADQKYEPGYIITIGGEQEVTLATVTSKNLLGVVSKNPAYLMNDTLQGDTVLPIAYAGRVICKVIGTIKKGDQLALSSVNGVATSIYESESKFSFGVALEDFASATVGEINIALGMATVKK